MDISASVPRFIRTRLAQLVVLSLLAACGGEDAVVGNVVTDNRVTVVSIDPPSASIALGANLTMRATALNAAGKEVVGQAFSWSSSTPAVVSVTAAGVATGVAAGGATITATTGGVSGNSTINVVPPVSDTVVASVTLTPSSASLPIAGTATLGASALNAAGQVIGGKTFTWSTSAASVATVSAAGVVTGVSAGFATITATSAGKSANAAISVTAAGSGDTVIANIAIKPASTTVVAGTNASLGALATNAAGQPLAGKVYSWTSSAPALASVSSAGVVTGLAVGGPVTITAAAQGQSATASVTVVATPTSSGTITVNGAQQFQTMTGWEALMEIGQAECDPRAYLTYHDEVIERGANEIGINRIRLGLRAGFENPVDFWPQRVAGQLTVNQWEVTWFRVVNDNADPFVINPAGFNFGYLDYTIEQLIIPLRQKLQARGEDLWVNISYTGAASPTGVLHRDNPDEYSELVLATFQHIQQKYGFSPNSFELVNEPNIGQWPVQKVAANLNAVAQRLHQAGFFPQFVGPTASGLVATTQMFDQMIQIPGVRQNLNEISWHRFGSITPADLTGIAQRAAANGMRTAMLEHGGSGHDHLHDDLTLANVSAWQQFGLAFCGTNDVGGMYLLVSGAKVGENNPVVNTAKMTKYLRQYFRYVGLRAVRIGASTTDARFAPVAFRNANGKYTVVVKASAGGSFTIGGLPAGTYGIDYTTPADYMKPLADVTITGAQALTTAIPDSGVITIFAK